jgi:hypothetical protein
VPLKTAIEVKMCFFFDIVTQCNIFIFDNTVNQTSNRHMSGYACMWICNPSNGIFQCLNSNEEF